MISQFSKEIDDILREIDKLYQKSFSPDFSEHSYAEDVAYLQDLFNDIKKIATKDEAGNALTDEDGKKIYSAANLLELDRQEHIHEIAMQKLQLLAKLANANFDENLSREIHKEYNNLQAKQEFFEGKSEQLAQRLDESQSETDNVALVYGPLNKNIFTLQYEELVKAMIRGEPFKLEQNPQTKEFIVKMKGKEYNLTQILKYANLTHLQFNQQDCDQYLNMLATRPMAYKPDVDQSDAAEVAIVRGKINRDPNLSEEEKKRQINALIDKVLLKNIDKQNDEKPETERDYSLAEISSAERLAINIWTTGFFDCANPFLRGDLESTFERTRAMSLLVGGCSLCLKSDMPASGPELGKIYLDKNAQGELTYSVLSPQNTLVDNQVLTINGLNLPPGELKLDQVNRFKDAIVAEVSKRGHVVVKENGREDALRELMCTTGFVMHGASYVSKDAPVPQQEVYRGDDGLYDPVLKQRLEAAKSQNVVSLNNIASTAQENPNVDFAFNSKEENKDKVKVGSIHTAMGKDISAISAFRREKEFLSVSRHKQYEAVLKTGENEYLFKVRDVTALNQLAPEELLTKHDVAEIDKRQRELNKKAKGLLPAMSSAKRKDIEAKQRANDLRREQLMQDKREIAAQVASLRRPEGDDQEHSHQNVTAFYPDANATPQAASRKRTRSESFQSNLRDLEAYIAKKIRTIRDLVMPTTAVGTTPNENIHPVHHRQAHHAVSTDPLMLPAAEVQHLRDLENELNQQPKLENSSGGIDHLLIRQYQVDTAASKEAQKHKTAASATTTEDKKEEPEFKPR
ncbi:MAG: hypothetical protein AB7I18_03950 [Candidatus Berkiella sp.]